MASRIIFPGLADSGPWLSGSVTQTPVNAIAFYIPSMSDALNIKKHQMKSTENESSRG
jgi:hypothetical protein